MTNIREIAKIAGVSVTTVSRVLNEHPYVSAEKRKQVLAVIEELDYVPNRLATNLAKGKTNTIGIILPYNDHPWFDKIANGVIEAAFKHKYSVTLFPTNYDSEAELRYLMQLKTKQVDALIITSKANDWDVIEPFADYGPIIACEYTEHENIACAYIERFHAYKDGFEFLKKAGYQKIAFSVGRDSLKSPSTQEKRKAYQEVFGEIPEHRFLSESYDFTDGIKAGEYFLAEAGDTPDAIFANGDEVAAGIMYYAKNNGFQIPGDLAILGEENLPIGKVLEITTLDHHLKKMGETAFQLFYTKSKKKHKISHQLIIRKTTK
ncbi:Catabolite control protein B [Listeria grayi]|uniref:Catabolite control protein B n=3 Tax=Listeria grayi TaxID=1641 RepID=D7UV72_LISGR|nr:LacI family DNA-binding transcriptional regulator [Listeria grayi]EFI85148.1 catabolite control protein B [Listeria grayi DSM 20601]EUJ28684.1 hypothetical protein LMUR_06337 [Listeria grayi FSL F6-1183]MBC1921859.1 LacI family DNA-binding transcriptional regulator [Listeria grayi]STY44635.1 Catabolite control protein B [Listeria grayi]VEI36801.1 Catabolite control protein B [Listeria grayi]